MSKCCAVSANGVISHSEEEWRLNFRLMRVHETLWCDARGRDESRIDNAM